MKHKQLKGFTLIESIIVIAITLTLFGALVFYSRGGEAQISFFKEESILVGVFLQARSFALDAFQPTLQPSPGGPGELSLTERVCAWGVHVEPDSISGGRYILFRDLDPAGPEANCQGSSKSYSGTNGGATADEAFQIFEVKAPLQVLCVGLVPDEGCQSGARDILFQPPLPKISFYPPSSTVKEFIVTLTLTDGSRKSDITVTKGGSVNVH